MNHMKPSSKKAYAALTVVSPMVDGDDKKDQDRARFFEPGQSACVCDGVTSSPNSAKAAELATAFCPALFHGDVSRNLEMLCDVLMTHRQESQLENNMCVPDGTSPAMQRMLQGVLQSKKTTGFQTTIIAVQLIAREGHVCARVIGCGDSALFAFSPQGELLGSSLARSPQESSAQRLSGGPSELSPSQRALSFGPGDEILVQVVGGLTRYPDIARRSRIKPEHTQNWIVCLPVHACCEQDDRGQFSYRAGPLALQPDDHLVVPKYLYGRLLTSDGCLYRLLRYSSTIRVVPRCEPRQMPAEFGSSGSSTLVLPDHFYTGSFDYFEDTFPLQTQFILCTDGLYGAFSEWSQLYAWLKGNAAALHHGDHREDVLQQLHDRLNSHKGDDDISFVWARPQELMTDREETDHVS